MEDDGVEAEESERTRGWQSKLFILVVGGLISKHRRCMKSFVVLKLKIEVL